MCCCCFECPEVQTGLCGSSVEKTSKIVAVIYFVEGLFLSIYSAYLIIQFNRHVNQSIEPHMNIEHHHDKVEYIVIFVVLAVFGCLYLIQSISSIFLLIGLTVKESTAFIRMFLIFNYLFIADDVLQLLGMGIQVFGYSYSYDDGISAYFELFLAFTALPFSIYSQILVGSHYKQVRRGITGPVQTTQDFEGGGFVNKYLKF